MGRGRGEERLEKAERDSRARVIRSNSVWTLAPFAAARELARPVAAVARRNAARMHLLCSSPFASRRVDVAGPRPGLAKGRDPRPVTGSGSEATICQVRIWAVGNIIQSEGRFYM